MILTAALIAVTSSLMTGLVISVKKNFELYDKIEALGEQVERSLDILDECHQRIDLKSKTNVLFDDPVVKDFLQDITDCKTAVLLVANMLYTPLENEEREDGQGKKETEAKH